MTIEGMEDKIDFMPRTCVRQTHQPAYSTLKSPRSLIPRLENVSLMSEAVHPLMAVCTGEFEISQKEKLLHSLSQFTQQYTI